ncbi:transcriptional regulatory protein SrrA [archaeon BMS3Bbin15]|nr:transcriptional regulatory protein SrrA [archaeon BMS3Bbin15]
MQAITKILKENKKQKILLVDDVPEIGELVKIILEKHSFMVEIARDARDGLIKAADGNPDLILMDIFLPSTSGVDATIKLRENGFRKPIILFSVLSEIEGIAREAKRAGADDYIIKPFEVDDFVNRVKCSLEENVTAL